MSPYVIQRTRRPSEPPPEPKVKPKPERRRRSDFPEAGAIERIFREASRRYR